MANGSEYESRNGAFGDGAHGGDTVGSGTHAASSIQAGVPSAFSPTSILQLPNMIQNDNGMSQTTFKRKLPMQSMLASTTGGE